MNAPSPCNKRPWISTHDETVEVAAGCVSLRGKHDQFTVRKIASSFRLILRQTTLEKPCSQLQVKKTHEETTEGEGFGSLRANHEQLTARKIFKINRKLPHPPLQQVHVEVDKR